MSPAIAKTLFVLCVIAWYVIRLPYQRRARATPVCRSARGLREKSLIVIAGAGLGIIPIIYATSGLPRIANRPFVPELAWVGAMVFAAALWLFHRTHHDLGCNWSPSLEVRESHSLVTNGIYARIRHPMYGAFWLWAVAQALLLPNWVGGLAGLGGFGALYFLRVGNEERLMLETFGEEYRRYMERTARLVPGLY